MSELFDRRRFLGLGAGLLGGTVLSPLVAQAARAAQGPGAADKRALVCVFLQGGLDADDVLIPYDQADYDAYAAVRAPLHEAYAVEGATRARDALLPLTGGGGGWQGGRAFAMPPELPRLAALFDAGHAAVVGSLGPLEERTDAAGVQNGGRVPPRLFSHIDQEREWARLAEPSELTGWGGRIADAALGPDRDVFTAIAPGASALWAHGQTRQPLTVTKLDPQRTQGTDDQLFGNREAARIFREHLLDATTDAPTAFARDYAARQASGVAAQNRLADAFATTTAGAGLDDPDNPLARQLAVVARSLALRDTLGASRQVFYVNFTGFDTHQNQAETLVPRLAMIDAALGAFWDWLVDAGMTEEVTLFTTSDFGRTLQPNASGTDHGWAGHSFVLGGAVRGGRILGEVPPAGLGHAYDLGRGRVVPTTASEQMTVPLARWFGVPEADMPSVFPRAERFDLSAIDLF